jgi:hypothetical protein
MKVFGIMVFGLMLFSACGEDENEKAAKASSKTEHFYYSDFVLRSFSDQNTNLTVKIPQCFEKDEYGSYAVNNKWMLKCYDNYSFLSIDYFMPTEIDNYFYYYAEEGDIMENHLDYLLKYIVSKRAANLIEPEISQVTTRVNERNEKFIFQSIVGRENDYQDNLFFMFGAVEINGQFFIVQSICAYNSIRFHLSDFKKIMLSIKRV